MLTKIIAVTLIIDFVGFTLWSLSGQIPVDNFFVGKITHSIINLII